MNAHIIYVYISQFINIFVVWKLNAHYLRLYILGYEPFCRGR